MKAKVLNAKGKSAKEIELNDSIWAVSYNADLVAQALYVYQMNRRVGTANAKTRGDVRGGGRKPWRQKGTGRARHGSIRSPIWKGGGVTFVPNDRNWSRKLNQKMRQKSVKIMLSQRLREEKVSFYDMDGETKRSEFTGKSLMIISDNEQIYRTFRNVPGIFVRKTSGFNVVDLVKAMNLIIDPGSVAKLEERLTK